MAVGTLSSWLLTGDNFCVTSLPKFKLFGSSSGWNGCRPGRRDFWGGYHCLQQDL